jgi:E3 ubiquitin-protein ligase RNF144
MHSETAKIAVELQLADINSLLNNDLYDEVDIPSGDTRTSLQIMRQDLEQQLQVLEGKDFLVQVLREEHKNRATFSSLLKQERQAVGDHRLAMQLAGMSSDNPDIQQSADYEATLCNAPDDCIGEQWKPEAWELEQELYVTTPEHELTDRAPLNSDPGATLLECCVCMEAVPSTSALTLKCKPEAHTYCHACLIDLFTSALANPLLCPPRCCKIPFPVDICQAILPKELIKDFDLKVEELATPNPTHCSNAKCSKFIRPKDIKRDLGFCVFCKETTCVHCKGSEHEGLCPSDPHTQLLMDMAKSSKWQQCTNCKNMVELGQGCFHMT